MLDFGLLINTINSNKVLWGMSMLMLNFGARYVVADLGKTHEIILSHEITKKLIVLSLFFVATRDILMSFLLTVVYILVIDGILHEKRRFCLVPKSIVSSQASQQNISKDDYMKAKNIIANYEANTTNSQHVNELTKKSLYMNYMNNIKMTTL
jgi:hypothetical protein